MKVPQVSPVLGLLVLLTAVAMSASQPLPQTMPVIAEPDPSLANPSCNQGRNNSGGCGNVGHSNRGSNNLGHNNVGSNNVGHGNVGNNNTGAYNQGSFNIGSHNVGNCNYGKYNTGNGNEGDRLSGYKMCPADTPTPGVTFPVAPGSAPLPPQSSRAESRDYGDYQDDDDEDN